MVEGFPSDVKVYAVLNTQQLLYVQNSKAIGYIKVRKSHDYFALAFDR